MRALEQLLNHRAVVTLASAFTGSGWNLYLVGGCVRDVMLGQVDFSDLDFTTDADLESVKRLLTSVADTAGAVWTTGERHGTIAAMVAGEKVEVTVHRTDSYADASSRQPQVVLGVTIEEDLARRDLTINAMAVALSVDASTCAVTGRLVDPYGGAAHLERGIVATPSEPTRIISDDPLRTIRAVRFAARFDASIAPELAAAIVQQRDRLNILSAERIADELGKIIGLGPRRCAQALTLANRLGIGEALVGGVIVDSAAVAAVERLGDQRDILAALMYPHVRAAAENHRLDPACGTLEGRRTMARMVSNAAAGAAGGALAALKLPKAQVADTLEIACLAAHMTGQHSDVEIARLIREHEPRRVHAALCVLDAFGQASESARKVRQRQAETAALRAPLPVNGHDMVKLGFTGAEVAQALDRVTSAMLADPHLTREAALDVAKK